MQFFLVVVYSAMHFLRHYRLHVLPVSIEFRLAFLRLSTNVDVFVRAFL